MNSFLASTRDLNEARIAYAAGADWLDMKEPGEGALGAVDVAEIERVVAWSGRMHASVPISATIGDCWTRPAEMLERVCRLGTTGIDYAKIGLYAADPAASLLGVIAQCCRRGPPVILVCFADAPPDARAVAAYAEAGVAGMMLDTADKTAGSLTQMMTPRRLEDFVLAVRGCKLLCGLAGSLAVSDIPLLAPLAADYLGFRGALCEVGGRSGRLTEAAVGAVRAALDEVQPAASANIDRAEEQYHGMAQERKRRGLRRGGDRAATR